MRLGVKMPPSQIKTRLSSKVPEKIKATQAGDCAARQISSTQIKRRSGDNRPEREYLYDGGPFDYVSYTPPMKMNNECAKEPQNETLSNLRQLETKQKLMEGSMRKLLRSMKELRCKEQKSGFSHELDKRRRVKLTRMIQILMLQRKNMQLQNDTLRKNVLTINRKFWTLRKRAETLLVENINMRKIYSQSKCDVDKKLNRTETGLLNKGLYQKEMGNTLEEDNIKHEFRKITIENHNLKESLKTTENLLKCKDDEKELVEQKCRKLSEAVKRYEGGDASAQYRLQQLGKENENLRKELMTYKNGKEDYAKKAHDFKKMKDDFDELQNNYHKLERLYLQESEHRRFLHNQLQEEKGNFRVICRVRPGAKASSLGFKGTDKIKIPDSCQLPRGDDGFFIFNRVFKPEATNRELFDETKSLLSSCIDGYNVCFLAYGPTGSGKTYSMQGTRDDPGLTLRTIAELSDLIESIKTVWEVRTSVSMIEIHNEVIYDLLSKCITSVRLSDDGYDVRLIDINEKVTSSEQDILFWIAKGHKRRKMAATKLNVQSSRSHLIIRISLFMQNKIDSTKRTSTLIFCDLAGSESAEKIDADDALKIETGHINRSLVTLSRVFDCLRHQKTPVPYRDSKLTHLLKPCLGGQAKCLLIVTISGEAAKLNRSIKALQFGRTAMDIAVGKIKQNISILSCKSLTTRFK